MAVLVSFEISLLLTKHGLLTLEDWRRFLNGSAPRRRLGQERLRGTGLLRSIVEEIEQVL